MGELTPALFGENIRKNRAGLGSALMRSDFVLAAGGELVGTVVLAAAVVLALDALGSPDNFGSDERRWLWTWRDSYYRLL
jgi:hypothetical protein